MGRGQGGSKSYGKRTPGGISTSSKMSKVGEIEAKHGVLGEEGNDVDMGQPQEGLLGQAKQKLASKVAGDLFENIKKHQSTEDLAPAMDEQATAVLWKELFNEDMPEGLFDESSDSKPSDDLFEEIKDYKSTNDGGGFVWTPDENELFSDARKAIAAADNEASSLDGAYSGSIVSSLEELTKPIGRKYLPAQAVNDAVMKQSGASGVLKWAQMNADSQDDDALERNGLEAVVRASAILGDGVANTLFDDVVSAHLAWLRDKGMPLEDANNPKLDSNSPMMNAYREKYWTPKQYYAYKTLLQEPVTREALESLYSKAKGDYTRFAPRKPLGIDEAGIRASVKPLHAMSSEGVDAFRKAVGAPEYAGMPWQLSSALRGQPIAKRMYQLGSVDVSNEEDLKNIWSSTTVDTYARKFDQNHSSKDVLSKYEKAALVFYTGGGYEMINDYLRSLNDTLAMYEGAKDPNMKKMIEERLGNIYTSAVARGVAHKATLFMNAWAKLYQYELSEGLHEGNRILTRGAQVPDMKKFVEGEYFYDSGVSSSADKSNWESNFKGTEELVLNTDKYIDARNFSLMQDEAEEDEFIIFPGILFKADFVKQYEAIDGRNNPKVTLVAGRQADLTEDSVKLADSQGAKAPWRSNWRGYTREGATPDLYEDRLAENESLRDMMLRYIAEKKG